MTTHPFEQAGLGMAPFRFVGCHRDVGPHRSVDPATGVTMEVGSAGQPMGTCAYCGQGIAECCTVADALGHRFIVGTTCIEKVDAELVDTDAAKSALRILRKRVQLQRQQARVDAALATLQRMPDLGRDAPHPNWNRVGDWKDETCNGVFTPNYCMLRGWWLQVLNGSVKKRNKLSVTITTVCRTIERAAASTTPNTSVSGDSFSGTDK